MTSTSQALTGGQALARQLMQAGVRHVFGVPGVQLDYAVDGLASLEGAIRYVVPRHEQATAYMADGYARSTGTPGVCMVVPGPGVLNACAGLATAYACSSRVLLVAGQIPSATMGRGFGMLHEVRDQSRVIASVTKWQALARRSDQVAPLVRDALDELYRGTPRPVAVEIPPDVLSASDAAPALPWSPPATVAPAASEVSAAAQLLKEARFPVIVAGGGVIAAGAFTELRSLAERLQAPAIMTEGGNGCLSARHALAVSALGARAILPHADVVLAVGTRFLDSRGAPIVEASKARIVLVNSDAADLGAPREAAVKIHCDARSTLAALESELGSFRARASRAKEVSLVREWCERQTDGIEPQASWVRALRASVPEDGIFVDELTQVGYLAHLAYPVYEPRTFISPGYQGTLGYGWATALGAAVGNPDRAVVCIAGDGGFGWNLQELATAHAYGLRAVVVVFNDSAFGNVKRLQQNQFGRVLGSELVNPDFVKLAQAFGVDGTRVSTPEALGSALKSAIAAKRPALIEVPVEPMPSAWHLLRSHYQAPKPPPANPLGEPAARS